MQTPNRSNCDIPANQQCLIYKGRSNPRDLWFKLFICGPELDLIREMINSDLKNTGSENRGTDMHTFDKQTPSTTKKVVLADVPVANRNLMLSHQEGLHFMERRPIADTIRFCGRKRFRPQNPVIPPVNPILSNTAAKVHLTYARNKFELETGQNRIQNSTVNYSGGSKLRPFWNVQQEIPQKPTQIRSNDLHYVPSITPNHMAPKMTLSCVPPSLPSSFGKPNNGVGAAECDSLKDSSDTQHFAKSNRANDQQWEERYIRLQNSLKRCDESDNRDLLQKIRQLSPAGLSMYVFELEKKSNPVSSRGRKRDAANESTEYLGNIFHNYGSIANVWTAEANEMNFNKSGAFDFFFFSKLTRCEGLLHLLRCGKLSFLSLKFKLQ